MSWNWNRGGGGWNGGGNGNNDMVDPFGVGPGKFKTHGVVRERLDHTDVNKINETKNGKHKFVPTLIANDENAGYVDDNIIKKVRPEKGPRKMDDLMKLSNYIVNELGWTDGCPPLLCIQEQGEFLGVGGQQGLPQGAECREHSDDEVLLCSSYRKDSP